MEYDIKMRAAVMYSVLYAHASTLVLCGHLLPVVLAHTVVLLACYSFGVLYSIKKECLILGPCP